MIKTAGSCPIFSIWVFLWFISNLRTKKKGLNICTMHYTCYIMNHSFMDHWPSWIIDRNLYILERLKRRWHCSEWVHPCFCSKQTFSHMLQPHDLGRFPGLPAPIAWLGYPPLGLPRSCYRPEVPHSSTYKSHWYTSQVNTAQQHINYIQGYLFSFISHSHGQVEEGWRGYSVQSIHIYSYFKMTAK